MNDLTLRDFEKMATTFFRMSRSSRAMSATSCDFEFAYSVKKAAFREYVERVFGWNEKHQRKLHEKRFLSQNFQVIQLSGHPATSNVPGM